MLPSKGYFSAIPCVFYLSGNCERPHCHYRHCVRDKTTNTDVEAADTSDSADEAHWFGPNLSVAYVTDMVEKAVDKVLIKNPHKAKTLNRNHIIRTALEQLRKENLLKNSPEPKAAPPPLAPSSSAGFPSYKPTPIAELNKRHIPVVCAPEKPLAIRKDKRSDEKFSVGPSFSLPQANSASSGSESSQSSTLNSDVQPISLSSPAGFLGADDSSPLVQQISEFLGYGAEAGPTDNSKNVELDGTSSDLQGDDEATIDFIQSNYSGLIGDSLTQLKIDASKERGENGCDENSLLSHEKLKDCEKKLVVTDNEPWSIDDLCDVKEAEPKEILKNADECLVDKSYGVILKDTIKKEPPDDCKNDLTHTTKSDRQSESKNKSKAKLDSHHSKRKERSSTCDEDKQPSSKTHKSSDSKRRSSSSSKSGKSEKSGEPSHKVKKEEVKDRESEKDRDKESKRTSSLSTKRLSPVNSLGHSEHKKPMVEKVIPDKEKSHKSRDKHNHKEKKKERENTSKNHDSHSVDRKNSIHHGKSTKTLSSEKASKHSSSHSKQGPSCAHKDGKSSSHQSHKDRKRKHEKDEKEGKRRKHSEAERQKSSKVHRSDDHGKIHSKDEHSGTRKKDPKTSKSLVIPHGDYSETDSDCDIDAMEGQPDPILISSADSSSSDQDVSRVTVVNVTRERDHSEMPSPGSSQQPIDDDLTIPVWNVAETARWSKAKEIIERPNQPKIRISSVPNVKSLLTAKTQLLARSAIPPKLLSPVQSCEELPVVPREELPVVPREEVPVAPPVVKRTDDEEAGPAPKVPQRIAHGQQGSERKPTIIYSSDIKINTGVRQNFCNRFYDELALHLTEEEAFSIAIREEFETAKKCSNLNSYRSCCSNLLLRIRKSKGQLNLETAEPELLGPSSTPDYTYGWNLYKCFQKYVATEEELLKNGYPMPLPGQPNCAYVEKSARKYSIAQPAEPFSRKCVNCRKIYEIDQDGMPTTMNDCTYHWGKMRRITGRTIQTEKYTCCDGGVDSTPCETNPYHVWSGKNEDCMPGFVKTREFPLNKEDYEAGVFALDCEMCYTTRGLELARLTVIDLNEAIIFDKVVAMEYPVLDYCTRFSGIDAGKVRDATYSFQDVQDWVLDHIFDKTILVGHSLENDLIALKVFHKQVVDTSIIFPHKFGPPAKNSLKNLASSMLMVAIQESAEGHDSKEDAVTCLQLLMKRIKLDSQVRKPRQIIGYDGKKR